MKWEPGSMFENISRRRWAGFAIAWAIILGLFGLLYINERESVMEEVRNHARGVAIGAAAGLDAADLEQVHQATDVESEAFKRAQAVLDRVAATEPDVRYIYTMRRLHGQNVAPGAYEYVVDQTARDINNNHVIDPDEAFDPPGSPYDASPYPKLLEAWFHATADTDVSRDPPFPDSLSGYAPIRNAEGRTVAIVGVDITAETIQGKLLRTRIVIGYVAVLMCTLVALVVQLAYQQREALRLNLALRDELKEKYDELQRLLQMREDLSRMVVHDMRNHLTIIETGCQYLAGGGRYDTDYDSILEQMNVESQRLNAFINDLLMLAKMEDGKFVLSPSDVDLRLLVRETCERSDFSARSRKVKVVAELPESLATVSADSYLLQRVLDNLVSNAVKFSPANGQVTIRVGNSGVPGAEANDHHHVKIDVLDEGPGIEEKYRDAIFDRFQVIDMKNRNIMQIGLGLAFCKMVVDAHQGRIFVQSNQPKGSVFTVEI